MKNKASLVLLEQLVMVLVFSLAAAACLRIFVWSDRTSREMQQHSEGVILCQNAAETLKAAADLEEGALSLGAVRQGNLWKAQYDGKYRLELEETQRMISGMGQAIVRTVSMETEETLFSLLVGWQEVAP